MKGSARVDCLRRRGRFEHRSVRAATAAYSLGLGIPFILAAVSVRPVIGSCGWARRRARGIMRIGGTMLVLLGLLQVSGLWTALIIRLRGVIVAWQVPL